ncbi:drug/metabolite transporter (DMT)-like permease [Kribbella aluminosa]|uniref:Drug/metabolite transporter (DMT)-like permease n=1 Tax=Kribbella aluminosa TaxID=416017 RepID=A0ABS4USV7_9ACTN|nr:DMT family transporter [Kribbella aluminosa]MBP2354732.1 drug/metabolite transporter (DMT)-like permease [Kribbella aluminosa]
MKVLSLAAGAGFVVFWSCGFIGARWGTQYTNAFDLLAWRFLVAGAIAVVILAVRRPRISRRDLATQVWMAFLTQFVYLGLIFTGIDHGITAGVTALIGSLQPILIATVAGLLLGERVSRRQWLGLVVGLVGVGLVVADDLSAGHGSPLLFLVPIGGLLGLVAGTCLDRRRRPSTSSLDALAIQSLTSAVLFTALAASTHRLTVPSEPGFYGAVLWLVLLATGGGWGLYLVNLKLSGATRISSLLYLVPPTTMLFAFLIFHETIGVLAVVGMLICAVAVLRIRSGEQVRCGDGGTPVAEPDGSAGVACVHRSAARSEQPDRAAVAARRRHSAHVLRDPRPAVRGAGQPAPDE